MRKRILVVASLVALTALLAIFRISPGWAGDPKEAILAEIDQGRAAFVAGRNQAALDHLQKAIALMQEIAVRGLASFLPPVPKGWKAEEPLINTGSRGAGGEVFQWNSAVRSYTREADQVWVEAMISTSPRLVDPQRQMMKIYRDPQMLKMMNQDPETKIEFKEKDGWDVLSVIHSGSNATVTALKANAMITLSVSNGSAEVLSQFWDSIDLAGLGSTLAADEPGRDGPEDE